MKRLLNSSKFWLAVIGTIVALSTWYITNDITFAIYTSGLFGFGIIGNTAEDMISKKQSNV